MISNLIKVCITALEADCFPSRAVPQPEHNIRQVLGYILDMMPYEEMEFLDKIRDMLRIGRPNVNLNKVTYESKKETFEDS